jgi:hypothetical protein
MTCPKAGSSGSPKYFAGQNLENSPCFIELEQKRKYERNKQKTEGQMRIREPFFIVFQSLQIGQRKALEIGGP